MAELHKDLVSKRTENLDTYKVLNEELITTTLLAQKEGTVKSDIDVPIMVTVMAASYLQAIQEARLSPEIFAEQHKRFMRQVHAIFRVPQDQTNVDAA